MCIRKNIDSSSYQQASQLFYSYGEEDLKIDTNVKNAVMRYLSLDDDNDR